jgi:hypothetical protein
MKLISLKINARGINGWESPLLEFGARTTSLHAPNGSGKTPLVQAIPFCLGFDAKFQNDIREKCESVSLVVSHGEKDYRFTRDFGEFRVLVESSGWSQVFYNEGDLSVKVFEELGFKVPVLVGTSRQPTKPFLSTLLPIFYVRQTGGYDDAYRAPAQFIPDQFVEMIRFAFGLGPKRSYTAQRELNAAKDQLDNAQRRVVYQQKVVTDLASRVDDTPKSIEFLNQRSKFLEAQIKDLRDSSDIVGAASDSLLELLHTKEERMRSIRRQHSEINARIIGISSIRSEIEGEIQTLSLNEESKRIFESFVDICARSDCGLFASSSASYAKSLMYLKDQLKDLDSNERRAVNQMAILDALLKEAEDERSVIKEKLKEKGSQAATGQLVSAVQSVTRELLDTEQRLAEIAQLTEEKRKYLQFDNDRSQLQDRIALLSNNGRQDLEFNGLRTKVQQLTVKWMDILETPNASREVEIDLDFKFRFGRQAIDVFNGSTRSRLILAIHAAIFEVYLSDFSRPFRFLILDTPKQQELASEDLAKYLHALEEVCDKFGGQILISSTEYHHTLGEPDREWKPSFQGPKQLMYLGAVSIGN